MEYTHFIDYIKTSMEQIMGPDVPVRVSRVLKNNSVHLDALTILPEGQSISPSIYLNDFYRQYEEGMPLPSIVSEINTIYETNKNNCMIDPDIILNFDYTKDHIAYKLINYSNNLELLQTVPHIRYLDFAIIFYILIIGKDMEGATAVINYEHMNHWHSDIETLFELAKINTPRLLPAETMPLEELMLSILMDDLKENARKYQKELSTEQMLSDETLRIMAKEMLEQYTSGSGRTKLFVMTNRNRCNGAAVLLYDHVLKETWNTWGKTNFYVLPSSIHEIILVPDDGIVSPDILADMVHDVNRTTVDIIDQLSDHIYYYDGRIEALTII